jgi:hypothetical protein
MVGERGGASSGRIALTLIVVLVFAVVAYVVLTPGLGTNGQPTGQSTIGPTTGATTHTTTPTTGSTTESSTTLSSNLIPEGGESGSLGPPLPRSGYFSVGLNSSTYAEVVWNATGAIDVYLYNSTGGLAFAKTGEESGNYTICVPATGNYNVKFDDPDVSYNAPIIQTSVNVYELRGSVCTPSP